jgi:hypothetical protein
LSYDLNVDAILPFNISKRWENMRRIPGKLAVGVNLKYIRRGQMRDDNVSVLELEDFEDPQVQTGAGLGADLGMLYQPHHRWNLGLAVLDAGGTSLDFENVNAEKGFVAKEARKSSIPARWNLGLAWTPAHVLFLPTGDRWLFTADVKDLINADSKVLFGDGLIADTAGTHLHFGAEFRYWFMRLRGGFNQGYPTLGAGLDIPFLKLDYTFYSDEIGLFAGTSKQSSHMITLALRFGSGRTEARDRVRDGKNAKKSGEAKTEKPAEPETEVSPSKPVLKETGAENAPE